VHEHAHALVMALGKYNSRTHFAINVRTANRSLYLAAQVSPNVDPSCFDLMYTDWYDPRLWLYLFVLPSSAVMHGAMVTQIPIPTCLLFPQDNKPVRNLRLELWSQGWA
jgi:hypothetical protein